MTTACSTLLSPLTTPLAIGLALHHFLPALATRLARWLPLVAMGGICMVIGITVAASREELLTVGMALLAASACHNATGYLLGFWGARAVGLNHTDSRTVALEVGIQNGGMATGLAFGVLNSPAAALASAVFGPWSAVTSSLLASWWRKDSANRAASSSFSA